MQTLLLADGIAALLFGAPFVIVPALMLSLFGLHGDPGHLFLARLLGASLLGYAGLMLLTRRGDAGTLKRMTRGQMAFDIVGVVVCAHAAWSGIANALMWGPALLFAVLVGWRGYLSLR